MTSSTDYFDREITREEVIKYAKNVGIKLSDWQADIVVKEVNDKTWLEPKAIDFDVSTRMNYYEYLTRRYYTDYYENIVCILRQPE